MIFKKTLLKYIIICNAVLLCIAVAASYAVCQGYPIYECTGKTLISSDYIFLNESLNRPSQVREIPITHEIVVLDVGNTCFYVFSPEGTFIRKFGSKGQGPGDMLFPQYFDVDSTGDIYVYEDMNKRISIFGKQGKFINSLRLQGSNRTKFSVSPQREIIMNLPGGGHFITVFSRDGKVIREIGKITDFPDDPRMRRLQCEGMPFKDGSGNYYIFLEGLWAAKIFDSSGNLIKEKKFNEIFPFLKSKEEKEDIFNKRVSSGMIPPRGVLVLDCFHDVRYKNGSFYILSDYHKDDSINEENLFPVFLINKDLRIEKECVVPFLGVSGLFEGAGGIYNLGPAFEVLHNGDILLPAWSKAEILLYAQKK